jgi:hypothetical protein
MTKVGGGRAYGIEPLMEEYGIDVYLTGHEHNYERWVVCDGYEALCVIRAVGCVRWV